MTDMQMFVLCLSVWKLFGNIFVLFGYSEQNILQIDTNCVRVVL